MALSLTKTQAVADLAEHLADFLPGKPHPFADPSISFPGVAARLGLAAYWSQGSKVPAVTRLLELTLDKRPRDFCTLVLEILRRGIGYRQRKNPITKTDVQLLDQLVVRCGFRIKDLSDPAFLNSLPELQPSNGSTQSPRAEGLSPNPAELGAFKLRLDELAEMAPVNRGFAFERFLGELFEAFGLAPRSSFRLVGEQIDGSFDLAGQTYLVEAKWQGAKINQADLLVFHGKIGGKAQWSRGLLISYSGFSTDGLEAFARGKQTNLVCMNRSDLYFVLAGHGSLRQVITRKARRAAEENASFVTAAELFPA
jgi:hypothetical protein